MTLFQCGSGIDSYHKQSLHSTFYANQTQFRPSQHTNIYMATLTTTKCRWPQWDAQCMYMKAMREEVHGQITQLMDGTYRRLHNTIDATIYI
jgi:hypothetical protein